MADRLMAVKARRSAELAAWEAERVSLGLPAGTSRWRYELDRGVAEKIAEADAEWERQRVALDLPVGTTRWDYETARQVVESAGKPSRADRLDEIIRKLTPTPTEIVTVVAEGFVRHPAGQAAGFAADIERAPLVQVFGRPEGN